MPTAPAGGAAGEMQLSCLVNKVSDHQISSSDTHISEWVSCAGKVICPVGAKHQTASKHQYEGKASEKKDAPKPNGNPHNGFTFCCSAKKKGT